VTQLPFKRSENADNPPSRLREGPGEGLLRFTSPRRAFAA